MEKYILGQSKIGIITKKSPKVALSIKLKENSYYDNALIFGYIKDLNEEVIENANISFLRKDNSIIGSVYSSEDGLYTFYGAKFNSEVRIIVKKSGYKRYVSNLEEICLRKYKYNVCLRKSAIKTKTLISGHLVDKNNIPLEGIFIYLIKKSCSNAKCIYKTTISNFYGQFIFSNIPKGEYIILINNSDYVTYNKYIEIIETNKIFNIDIELAKKEICTLITGQITNDMGKIIPNALVILYRVEKDGKLITEEYDICDENGRYSFINIPYNNYIVKAIES